MAELTEGRYAGEFMCSEANGNRSRDVGILASGNLAAGTVLGKVTKGTATAALDAGATGNGTFSAVTLAAGAQPGVYVLTATSATKFNIEDPAGVSIGVVTLGAAFAKGGLAFTFTAGATPHVAGDQATITVAAGSGKFVAYNQDGTDGSEIAAGILYAGANAIAAEKNVVAIVRDAEVNVSELVWPADIGIAEINTAIVQLAALGIIVRG